MVRARTACTASPPACQYYVKLRHVTPLNQCVGGDASPYGCMKPHNYAHPDQYACIYNAGLHSLGRSGCLHQCTSVTAASGMQRRCRTMVMWHMHGDHHDRVLHQIFQAVVPQLVVVQRCLVHRAVLVQPGRWQHLQTSLAHLLLREG